MSDQTQTTPDPLMLTLSAPVQVIDQMVSQIRMTPPKGRHLMKAGAALRIITKADSDDVGIEINPDAMGKLIGVCFNLPIRTVEELPAADFMACSMKLMPFLAAATS